jgi:hypothetical protein
MPGCMDVVQGHILAGLIAPEPRSECMPRLWVMVADAAGGGSRPVQRGSLANARAAPKSASLTQPSSVTRMLAPLRSRCTILEGGLGGGRRGSADAKVYSSTVKGEDNGNPQHIATRAGSAHLFPCRYSRPLRACMRHCQKHLETHPDPTSMLTARDCKSDTYMLRAQHYALT